MDASLPLMFGGRKGWTLTGRRHQSAKREEQGSSQANRRIRDEDYQNRRRRGYGEASVPVALD